MPTSSSTTAYVATSETTTSTSYTDLTTPGPAVTFTVGSQGKILVGVSAKHSQSAAGNTIFMGFVLSGANTLAADDKYATEFRRDTNATLLAFGDSWLITGLNAGSTTATAKYKQGSGTATFELRHIWAITL